MLLKSYALWAALMFNVGLTLWKASIYFTRFKHFSASTGMFISSVDVSILTSCLVVSLSPGEDVSSEYTYLGDDYPIYYPTGPLEDVAMTLQTSTHFSLNSSSPTSDAEWGLLASMPHGFGRTRLGPRWRMFVIVVYHQMHCLRKIQVALLDRDDPISTHHHVLHCLNYLRQLFLCEAADSLEEGDFLEMDWEQDRIGDTLVCKDFERVYDVLDENYDKWLKWRDQWN